MLVLAATFRSSGLLISFGLGLVLATGLSGIALARRINRQGTAPVRFHMPWNYLSATSGNYLATVIGILPLTLVPIEVLAVRGAAQTAAFSIAFLISGFLNFIPSTTGRFFLRKLHAEEYHSGSSFAKPSVLSMDFSLSRLSLCS